MAAGDQVEAVLPNDRLHQFYVAGRVPVQPSHRIAHVAAADERQQLRGEDLGQEDELRLVLGGSVEDVAHLLLEFLPAGYGLHLVLHGRDAHFHRISPSGRRVARFESYLGFNHTISDAYPQLSASSGR